MSDAFVDIAHSGWRVSGRFGDRHLRSVRILGFSHVEHASSVTMSKSDGAIREFKSAMSRFLSGERISFDRIALDQTRVNKEAMHVYRLLRQVPYGATVTYGELAEMAGMAGCARFVGRCMAANPWPIVVPCHRVLGAGTGLGGFSAPGGLETKRALLALEGGGTIAGQFTLPGM